MKEFVGNTGGRNTYLDDFLNLQDLSLAFSHLFDECDNFVLSGCRLSGNVLTEGYVYLNKKIRYCARTVLPTVGPYYLYESNTVEKVSYVDSGDKVGRNVYGCAVAASLPGTSDPLTGDKPQFILMQENGECPRLPDAFFGKYAVTVSGDLPQTVGHDILLNGNFTAGGITAANKITVEHNYGNAIAEFRSDRTFALTVSSGKHKYAIEALDGEVRVKVDSSDIYSLTKAGMTVSVPVRAIEMQCGKLAFRDNSIEIDNFPSDEATMLINFKGHRRDTAYYRNTVIGDGKGEILVKLVGKSKKMSVNSSLVATSPYPDSLTIKSVFLNADPAMQNYITLMDASNHQSALFGFVNADNNDFIISNKAGSNICLLNDTHVHGRLIVDNKDVLAMIEGKLGLQEQLKLCALKKEVYTIDQSNKLFLTKANGVQELIDAAGSGVKGQEAVRNALGAAPADISQHAVRLENMLRDMVQYGLDDAGGAYETSRHNRQKEICNNIGAVHFSDIAASVKDTGWIDVEVTNQYVSEEDRNLVYCRVRQVGHMVYLTGHFFAYMLGDVLTLPAAVSMPSNNVSMGGPDSTWYGSIQRNSRTLVGKFSGDKVNEYLSEFDYSLIYMV